MRTTLDLPEKLLAEAMKRAHISTKTEVITFVLQELIRKSKISELKKFKGSLKMDMDLNALRKRA